MSRVILPDYDYYSLVNRDHELAQGLVSWWRVMPGWFGGTTWHDLMQRNDATLTNMALPATSTSGAVVGTSRQGGDGEVRFDGTNDVVDCGNVLGLSGTGDFCLAAWVHNTNQSSGMIVVGKDIVGGRQISLVLNQDENGSNKAGRLTGVHFRDSSGNLFLRQTGDGIVPASAWAHIQFERQGGVGSLWKNGQMVGSSTIAYGTGTDNESIANTTTSLRVGARAYVGSELYFAGSVDDIMVASRSYGAALYQSSRLSHPDLLRHITYTYYSIPSSPPASTRVKIIGGGLLLGAA